VPLALIDSNREAEILQLELSMSNSQHGLCLLLSNGDSDNVI